MSETVITGIYIVGTFLIKFNGNKHNGKKYTIEPVEKLSVPFSYFLWMKEDLRTAVCFKNLGLAHCMLRWGNSPWQLPMLIETT